MKDRIKQIIEKENLTPAKFADKLQINRAIISHILNGRNNPSLDVVSKILSEMNYINPEWLINGTGEMYKSGFRQEAPAEEPDLFNQIVTDMPGVTASPEKLKETGVKQANNIYQIADKKQVETIKIVERKITQIIIYYSDNTFEIFSTNMNSNTRSLAE